VPAPSASAISLDEVEKGVLASFEASANVDDTGQFGEVTPALSVRVTRRDSGCQPRLMTGYESTVTVCRMVARRSIRKAVTSFQCRPPYRCGAARFRKQTACRSLASKCERRRPIPNATCV